MITLLIINCKKDSLQSPPPDITSTITGYFPLSVGNYWIYDIYRINDTTGLEEQLNIGDTVRIIAEEIINNNTYYSFEQKQHWISFSYEKDTIYLRDSSEYIVNLAGDIIFSSTDFNNILHQIDYSPATFLVEYSVSDTVETRTVPSGTFECLNYKGRVQNTDPNNDKPDRFMHNCYADNVGLVFQTIFYSSSYETHFERRLSDYHLE